MSLLGAACIIAALVIVGSMTYGFLGWFRDASVSRTIRGIRRRNEAIRRSYEGTGHKYRY